MTLHLVPDIRRNDEIAEHLTFYGTIKYGWLKKWARPLAMRALPERGAGNRTVQVKPDSRLARPANQLGKNNSTLHGFHHLVYFIGRFQAN